MVRPNPRHPISSLIGQSGVKSCIRHTSTREVIILFGALPPPEIRSSFRLLSSTH
jgi:hypothetical protein